MDGTSILICWWQIEIWVLKHEHGVGRDNSLGEDVAQ